MCACVGSGIIFASDSPSSLPPSAVVVFSSLLEGIFVSLSVRTSERAMAIRENVSPPFFFLLSLSFFSGKVDILAGGVQSVTMRRYCAFNNALSIS